MTLVLRDSCDMLKLKLQFYSYVAQDGAIDASFYYIVRRHLSVGENTLVFFIISIKQA